MSHTIDVLNLEWNATGRDREIILPIQYYLERVAGLRVHNAPIWDLLSIDTCRPRLVLMANADGDSANTTALEYCHQRNIPVVHLMSEGVFPDSFVETGQFWGWNAQGLTGAAWLVWSDRLAGSMIHHSPQLEPVLRVSGATGFDRYQYVAPSSRQAFLDRIGRPHASRIVGLAGYGMNVPRSAGAPGIPQSDIDEYDVRMQRDKPLFKAAMHELVRALPDVLFVCKPHPAERGLPPHTSELAGLETEPNVYMAPLDAPIEELIAVSDIWMGYESTTALEVWCMDAHKPVVFINPTGSDFPRSAVVKGVVVAQSGSEAAAHIMEYCTHGHMPAYTALQAERTRILREIIGWADGFNHVRAAQVILEVLDNTPAFAYSTLPCGLVPDKLYAKALYRRLAIAVTRSWPEAPVLRRFAFVHELFDLEALHRLMATRYADLDTLYAAHGEAIAAVPAAAAWTGQNA